MSTNGSTPLGIERVFDVTADATDRCTPGGKFIITGRGFGERKEVPLDAGVYLHGPTGTPLHRIHRYLCWHDDRIEGSWPLDLRGPQRLFIEIGDAATVHGVFYPTTLIPWGQTAPGARSGGAVSGMGSAAGEIGGFLQRREPPAEPEG